MKSRSIKNIVLIIFISVLAGSFTSLNAQVAKETDLQAILQNKNFIFKAQSVSPLGGRTRQLTSPYDMKVIGDSLVTYLPYFGRAYSAPVDPTHGGIQFTSTSYDYNIQPKKKGWDIKLSPKDNMDVRELLLSVSKSGYATLSVTSNNRQYISYSGYVTSRK